MTPRYVPTLLRAASLPSCLHHPEASPAGHLVLILLRPLTLPTSMPRLHPYLQALSNSIWAVAHARSKLANFDGLCGPPGSVCAFLVAIAVSANTMLKALYSRLDLAHLSAFLNTVEHKFSCQALVNIVWSFATILGDECAQHPIIKQLFVNSRKEAIVRCAHTAC